jgi:hypothetical protein
MIKYADRTPESIAKEYKDYTYEGVKDLAKYLDTWMTNEHNGRLFMKIFDDMKGDCPPSQIARALLSHALDWFAYGN